MPFPEPYPVINPLVSLHKKNHNQATEEY